MSMPTTVAPPRPKRPQRNAKKKKASYEETSEEEEVVFATEDSEQSEGSEFEDSDGGRSKMRKKSKKMGGSGGPVEQDESVVIPMSTKIFERILDYQKNYETGEEKLLVKYKNSSFHHVEWVPLDQIEAEHLGKHRVKKFLQKWYQDGEKGEDFREHLKLDRIIDEGELTDPVSGENKIFYLAKWNGLYYDQCTWETDADVERIDKAKIDEFHAHRIIPPQKVPNPPPRPDFTRFMKYDSSPVYRYSNSLRSYQLEGLNWLRFCYFSYRSSILADEMGLGKTVQSVAFLNDIYHHLGVRGPFLVVAPLSTIPHWERAFKAWTDLNVIDYRGSQMARNLIYETEFYYKDINGNIIPDRYKFDVIITTYEMASAGADVLKGIPWRCGIFDEAHRLKNKQSKVLEVLKTFYLEHKVLLTGTPLQNNLDELYSLLNFLQPEIFSDEKLFFAEYGALKTAAEVEKLQALLKPIMLRRFKEDVEKTIPVKEETVVEVELTNPQKKWYRAILEKNFSFLKRSGKSNKEVPHLRNIMMQLRKCCVHPYLLEGAEEVIVSECNAKGPQEQFNCLVQSSGKLVLIDKLLKKLIQGNHKVLIFSQFTTCLDILADYLRGRSYAYERIDGSVPGDQRQAAIDRFSTLPIEESFVFLLCTRAGGVGINLTAADTCIIFDSDWNPQNDLQAQARCHRIGQTKPVQIYRLICANTYEKDMFDRAGMKLGLDKAVMSRAGSGEIDESGQFKNELSKKQIEDLLKKGAYGAMLDDEASTQFCEEDIDQILERRTTVIKHEGNEKGSVFSKATFSTTSDNVGVELDDPDFWEKWAAKANIETKDAPDENKLIVAEPRRRRRVQRFGARPTDGNYSSNDNGDDSDAYEEEEDKPRKNNQSRSWSLSEKTKYERKLMIYGYGRWDQMQVHFPRRSEKDLKAVTRALMRKVLPTIEASHEEDRKLIDDIEDILEMDADDEVEGDDSIPYVGASKKQISEFKSFLAQAPADYIEHVERKGRNFLLRIQMLHLIRDKIVPKNWKEAKALPVPKVTGSLPADWWTENEDRSLLLGICKHGYQQYLAMRNDPEFSFYGKKYDDSKAGSLEDDDIPTGSLDKNDEDYDSRQGSVEAKERPDVIKDGEDGQIYVWPSKADIGMRLRRIIAAFLREHAGGMRRRRGNERDSRKDRGAKGRRRETRQTQRQRSKMNEISNRWSKKNKGDFLRVLMSYGVDTELNEPDIRWDRFKEIAGLEKKTDESLDLYYQTIISACDEVMKRHEQEVLSTSIQPADQEASGSSPSNTQTQSMALTTSRESSLEPQSAGGAALTDRDDSNDTADLVPFDKARRALRRIAQMKKIREEVIVNPDLDALLLNARKTSGLPGWWEVPAHDKALLLGICQHGIGRSDLLIEDPDLPFYKIKQKIVEDENIHDPDGDDANLVMEKFAWPKDLVISRRIDALCDLIMNPKPPSKRQTANRKRKATIGEFSDKPSKIKLESEINVKEEEVQLRMQDLSDGEVSAAEDIFSESGDEADIKLEDNTESAQQSVTEPNVDNPEDDQYSLHDEPSPNSY
ncbi:P-loop containing nucleoside triphosphate hydrolase protein [Phycomyces blakesleeanus]